MDRDCDFKDLQGSGECHKSWLTRQTALEKVCDFEEEFQQTLLWRAGLKEVDGKKELMICSHHKELYGSAFEKKFQKCCNIYGKHTRGKKAVKGGHVITLELAMKLKREGQDVCPGWQLCRNCLKIAKTVQEAEEVEMETDEEFHESTDFEEQMTRDTARESVDTSFEELGISPIKLHAVTKQRKISDLRNKLDRAVSSMEEMASTAANIDRNDLKRKEPRASTSSEIEAKAADLDTLMFSMKEKIQEADSKTKIQVLTLTPDSWSRKAASQFFNVSEYAMRTARNLKKERGILAIPDARKGRTITEDTKAAVLEFYQDDEYTRLMPGKKDSVSIGKKVHKQKRLILCNLHELFSEFKKVYPTFKVGFSKFCSLRPKWCVTVSSSGTHSVCVCTHHQNTQLLVHAANIDKTYKELMGMMVCNTESKMCMIHRCPNCPGSAPVKDYLEEAFESVQEDEILFQQWQGTDRAMLVSQTATIEEFIELVVEAVNNLTSHSFIAKSQAKYLKEKKENLDNKTCIILLDFAENYQFVVQDEIQGFHWNKLGCTLHPVVVYYKDGDTLKSLSICIISDDMEHDTCFVHQVQKKALDLVKKNLPHIQEVQYFSDGCAAQYKNFKNLLNLCYHASDFGLAAEWSFFATSHGKSPCDGIGGTVKRLTARASLQRPEDDQILSTDKMFDFCNKEISGITFIKITKDSMKDVREMLNTRFELGRTVPGTRSYHHFSPTSTHEIQYKRVCEDNVFSGSFKFLATVEEQLEIDISEVKIMDFVISYYDSFWWIGLVEDINRETKDFQVKFMHPHGPATSFSWPARDDICWVPFDKFVCKIEAPTTVTGRTYTIRNEDMTKIMAM